MNVTKDFGRVNHLFRAEKCLGKFVSQSIDNVIYSNKYRYENISLARKDAW